MRAYRSILPLAVATAAAAGAAFATDRSSNPLDAGNPVTGAWAKTGTFTALGALGPDAVRFTSGSEWRVRAEGDPRTLERLRFVVKDGQLLIGRRSGEYQRLPAATVHVTAPALRGASLAGSGVLTVDRLSGESVSATIAGSGDMAVDQIEARSVKAAVAGSGDLTVSGRAGDARLSIAGSGRLEGSRFTADTARAAIAGSGDMVFRSSGTVSATISGSGDVIVTGGARCTQKRSGSGRLRCSD